MLPMLPIFSLTTPWVHGVGVREQQIASFSSGSSSLPERPFVSLSSGVSTAIMPASSFLMTLSSSPGLHLLLIPVEGVGERICKGFQSSQPFKTALLTLTWQYLAFKSLSILKSLGWDPMSHLFLCFNIVCILVSVWCALLIHWFHVTLLLHLSFLVGSTIKLIFYLPVLFSGQSSVLRKCMHLYQNQELFKVSA